MSFGQRLRERRKELGISQGALAKALGVSLSAVSNYENDLNAMREEVLVKAFEALDVEPNYLFQDSFSGESFTCSVEEQKLVRKYRTLRLAGRQAVQSVADSLCTCQQELEAERDAWERDAAEYEERLHLLSCAKQRDIVSEEREDFMEEPPKKYFRLFPGNEVRLMSAYFVTCTGYEKDESGNVTVIHATYDPATKSGSGFCERKVKGTIHWVLAETAKTVECRLYENIVDEEKGKLNEDGTLNLNPNSLTVLKNCYVEPALIEAKAYDSFQFVRNGFFCADCKDSVPNAPVFNRIVSLKSSFKLPK